MKMHLQYHLQNNILCTITGDIVSVRNDDGKTFHIINGGKISSMTKLLFTLIQYSYQETIELEFNHSKVDTILSSRESNEENFVQNEASLNNHTLVESNGAPQNECDLEGVISDGYYSENDPTTTNDSHMDITQATDTESKNDYNFGFDSVPEKFDGTNEGNVPAMKNLTLKAIIAHI